MKKLFFFLAAVAALGSCAKEPVGDGNSPVSNIQPISVEAVAPDSSDEPDMKTTLVDDAKVHWVKGDQIKVMFVPINGSYEISQNMYEEAYVGAQGVLQSTLESDYAAKATFSTDSWDWGPGADYMGVGIAVYPLGVNLYSNRQKNYYNSNSVTQISYNLPSDQTAVANSFQNGIAFSYAEIALENKEAFAAGNAKLEFKNACALIQIVLPSDADDVVSVKVESANGTLSGNYKVPTSGLDIVHNSYQTYYPKFPLTLESDGGVNYVTLSAPEGETLQAGGSYYIVTWPGTHSGLTFTFTNSAGLTLTKTVNTEVVLEASEYDRFTFKKLTFEHVLEVSDESIQLEGAATNGSFTVTSSRAWTASSSEQWLRLTTTSGEASGVPATVNFSAYQNNSGAERTADITITSGDDTKTITVTQAAIVAEVSISRYGSWSEFNANGDFQYVSISSNVDWTLTCDQDWLTLSETSGSAVTGTTVMLTAAANTTTSQRTATLYLRDANNTVEKTFEVVQERTYKVVKQITEASDLEDGAFYVIEFKDKSNYYWKVDNNGNVVISYVANKSNGFTKEYVCRFEKTNYSNPIGGYNSFSCGYLYSVAQNEYFDWYDLNFTIGFRTDLVFVNRYSNEEGSDIDIYEYYTEYGPRTIYWDGSGLAWGDTGKSDRKWHIYEVE